MLSIRYEWPKGRKKGKEFYISHGKYMYYNAFPETQEEKEEREAIDRYYEEILADGTFAQEEEDMIKRHEAEMKEFEAEIKEYEEERQVSGDVMGRLVDDQRGFNKIRRGQGNGEYPTFYPIMETLFEYEYKLPGEWSEEYADYMEYENPLGTALVDFINFDIDLHINGGYEVRWDWDGLGHYVSGWNRYGTYYLKDNRWNRHMIYHMLTDLYPMRNTEYTTPYEIKIELPFFLKMYSNVFYDFENWQCRQDGITYIKGLQKRIRYAVEKTFIPENGNDKRTALERYNDNKVTPLAPLTEEAVRKQANTKWEEINSLEYALSVEFYAMMYCDIMVILCDNCGLYSIPKKKDRRTRYCSRKYYTEISRIYTGKKGNKIDMQYNYVYSCMEDGITAGQHKNDTNDIITYTIMLDRERLRKFCSNVCKIKNEKFRDIVIGSYDRLVCVLEKVIEENEAEFRKRLDKLQNQEERANLGCEFTKLIDDAMNNEIKEIFRESRIERLAEKDIEDSFTLNYKKRIKKYLEKFK